MVPSLDDVMSHQNCVLALDVHVSPESVDVQRFPLTTEAASLVPSLDDVTPLHSCVLALGVHEALTEASEANESNTASRTRSMVFGSTSPHCFREPIFYNIYLL